MSKLIVRVISLMFGICSACPVFAQKCTNPCTDPSYENTAAEGRDYHQGTRGAANGTQSGTHLEDFAMTLTGAPNVNWNGQVITETTAGTGTDTCWFSGSPYTPGTLGTGASCTVGAATNYQSPKQMFGAATPLVT